MIRATTLVISGVRGRHYDKTDIVQSLYERFSGKVPPAFKKKLFYTGWLQIPLLDGSPELEELLGLCKQFNLSFRAFSDVHYTKKELEQCQFFHLELPCPTELDGISLKDFGNVYEDACPVCRFGTTLRGDVLVDRKYPKKYKMGVIPTEVYMSEEIKSLAEEHGWTGISFDRKLVDFKGREMADFYVPDFSNVLPPMSETAWFNPQTPCRSCGHRTLYVDSDYQYERGKLSQAKDFNLTHEYINNDEMRQIIVSARVRKILQQNKIYCWYFPVSLI